VETRELELVRAGDLRDEIVNGGLYQEFLGQANAVVILAGLFQRARWKYHERTYRYALIEAGHYGQNVYLAATALGHGAAAVGAFFDTEVNRMLGLDGIEEAALYLVAVGSV
jgi:SagB-type dehydrogenase family enzyme